MNDSQHTHLRLADGRNLEVFMSGPANGLVLLFHNGTPGGPIRAMSAAAHRQGLRFVTTWRPGYGESTRQAGRSVGDVAADTETVLNFLGVSRCLVFGGSGGGPYALACAARLPDRVAAVMVMASWAPYGADDLDWTTGMSADNVESFGIALKGETAVRPYNETAHGVLLQAAPADVLAALSSGLPPVDLAVVTEEIAADMATNFGEGLRLGADGWIDDDLAVVKPWGFSVSEVAIPTGLWHGTEDRLVPVTHGQWLAAQIPSVVAHFEPDEGHLSIGFGYVDQGLQELVDASRGRLW